MKEKDLILKDLGCRVKNARLKISISQEQLAEKCQFDRTYISLIERGKRNPSYINLLKLAEGLNINLSILLGEHE